jgi:tetratricopeptide (TPR) repeat protein
MGHGTNTKGALLAALFTAVSAASTLALTAHAAGGSEPPPPSWPADPVVEQLQAYVKQKDWQRAAAYMKDALAKNPGNADYNNLYAFAVRKGPNPDMALVFKHYNEALRIDPKHRNAHEYIGEAYLMTGNLAKAREHLAVLDRLCTFGCEEYTELKKAVAEYEAKKK